MPRPLRITLEIIASLVGIAVALGLFLIWRLNMGPIQAAFVTPAIETGIENLIPGTQVTIAHTLLSWDDVKHSVALHADDLHVNDSRGNAIAAVPEIDVELSAIGLIFGQFLPKEMTVVHPQLRLERQKDGSFTFGGVTENTNASTDIGDEETLKDGLARIAGHLAHAFFTRKLEVSRSTVDIHDEATGRNWSVNIPEISLERSGRDLSGGAVFEVTQKDHVSTLDVHYSYDRANDLHRLTTRFDGITPAFFAGGHPATLGFASAAIADLPLTGEISLGFDSDMNIAAANAQLHGDAGLLNSPTLWNDPRPVKTLDIKADYDSRTGKLDIPDAAIDFGGPQLTLSATGTMGTATESSTPMEFALSVQLDKWPMDQYGKLWPQSVIPGAREWIAANLSHGTFDHAEANFKGVIDWKHLDATNVTEGAGKITASGARVHYIDGMPDVEGVNADATFDLDHLTAQLSGGGIGDIKTVPFALTITGFQNDVQNIEIPLQVEGPIPSIMRLIDHPPLGYTKAVGLSPDDISGQARAQVTLRFPLLKDLGMKDIGVTGTANLSDVASSRLVKGVDITHGNLRLGLTADGFTVDGPATINAIPLQVTLEQAFDESPGKPLRQVTVTGVMSTAQWQTLGVDAFNGTKGSIGVALKMTQPTKSKTLFSGTIDMTDAETRIDQLNWKKPAHIPATGTFAAEKTIDGDLEIAAIDFHGPQMNVKGKATLTGDDNRLTALSLDPMIVGRTDAVLHFSRLDDESAALHFDAEGKSLDISGFKGGHEPENAQPEPKEFRIKVGKLLTSNDGFIAHAEGYAIRDAKGWSEINLHGLADGGHPLAVELTARSDGGRDFSLTCDDFGKALKGLGFADKVRGGKLDVHGASDPNDPRAIVGKLSIGSFVAGDLPVLAVLMNAASPFGFAGLFSDSMDFDHVRGEFRWEGDEIKLTDVHAAGAAVSINVDGHVNMDSGDANLHGTMVPFSVVNSVIGAIPLIGDLFTGGKNQGILAVAYTIKGPTDNPKIDVNPASLLTPGFLRNLFFGGDDDDKPGNQ